MSSNSTENPALSQLQSKQKDLLDDIDTLRNQGIGHYIELPQLIVCGDQSSGKSSVLEAISRVRFPSEAGVCTRFATEVVLRRAPTSGISVSIKPGDSRTQSEHPQLSEFRHSCSDASELPLIINKAKDAMGISADNTNGRSFTDDILCVDISGPDKPHLTLVDLPGLIRHSDRPSDIALVKRLVESYMANKRSVILAIVSANYDTAIQEVLTLLKKHDPEGLRTLGIVTKPDRLEPDSDDEMERLRLIRNERISLRLGWHVVRNRNDATRNATDAERDDAEMSFLTSRVWAAIDRGHKGIESLRSRLSEILTQQISSNMPKLVSEIKQQLFDCKERLNKLGEPRKSPKEQRRYLLNTSSKFQDILRNVNEGRYLDNEFSSEISSQHWSSKRLRAAVDKLNQEFADTMHQKGHRRQVLSDTLKDSAISHPWRNDGFEDATISRIDLASELDEEAIKMKPRGLPDFPNALLVSYLFKDQAKPWDSLSRSHLKESFNTTRRVVRSLLAHVANEDVSNRISREIFDPWLLERQRAMEEMLKLLLKPHLRGDTITFDPSYRTTTKVRREAAVVDGIGTALGVDSARPLESLGPKYSWLDIEAAQKRNMNTGKSLTSLDLIADAEVYYEIAMHSFIDNVCIFVIEHCLLDELVKLFNHEMVSDMEDAALEHFAAESPAVQMDREQLHRKMTTLEKGLMTCSQYEDISIPGS
ncbi:hypothetical protein NA57DRAFT_46206 [Rhizodiscina lignyota]|uniref:Dynamin family protein n=1 Tax=Rhizodiscina lignyota TaxID=1504668 RepID=A0A9P4M275_9PEZI|nr:hypothetical protein NA57DRAFT_46206 [Rhizodiscina lignyota]